QRALAQRARSFRRAWRVPAASARTWATAVRTSPRRWSCTFRSVAASAIDLSWNITNTAAAATASGGIVQRSDIGPRLHLVSGAGGEGDDGVEPAVALED